MRNEKQFLDNLKRYEIPDEKDMTIPEFRAIIEDSKVTVRDGEDVAGAMILAYKLGFSRGTEVKS